MLSILIVAIVFDLFDESGANSLACKVVLHAMVHSACVACHVSRHKSMHEHVKQLSMPFT